MKPKHIFIVLVAAWILLIGTKVAGAQLPPPLVPATGLMQSPTGLSGWCGKDFVFLVLQQENQGFTARLIRLSNEPEKQSVKFFLYGSSGKLLIAIVDLEGGVRIDAFSALANQSFWRTWQWASDLTYEPAPARARLIVLLRQPKQDCLLTKEVIISKG